MRIWSKRFAKSWPKAHTKRPLRKLKKMAHLDFDANDVAKVTYHHTSIFLFSAGKNTRSCNFFICDKLICAFDQPRMFPTTASTPKIVKRRAVLATPHLPPILPTTPNTATTLSNNSWERPEIFRAFSRPGSALTQDS